MHKQDKLEGKFYYPHRHKVLFNLYAFDTVRSNRTHSPTLNLINCDFKYFLNNEMEALIQVETNNFMEMGIEALFDVNPVPVGNFASVLELSNYLK